MDIKTLFICQIIINLTLGVFMFAATRVQKAYPGFHHWAASSLLMACGYLLWALRGTVSDIWSVLAAAALFGVVAWLRLAGLRVFFGGALRYRQLWSVAGLVAAMCLFRYGFDSIVVRAFLLTGFLVAFIILTSAEIWRHRSAENKVLYTSMVGIYLFDALFMTLRVCSWLIWPQTVGFLTPSFMNVTLFILQMGVDVTWVTFFFAMNAQRMNMEIMAKNLELEEAGRMKDRFLTILAHDLRGPIGSLKGGLQTLTEDHERYAGPERSRVLGLLLLSAEVIYGRLENLLAWGGLQGASSSAPRQLRFAEIVGAEIALAAAAAERKAVALANEVDPEAVVFADPDAIGTVVRNLLSNAVKFSQRGGTVRVGLALAEDAALVSVSDEGVGIPAERLERLFSPGRVPTTRGTEQEVGTGLGLSICAECVKQHGGKIWAERNEPRGVRFLFTLPAEPSRNDSRR